LVGPPATDCVLRPRRCAHATVDRRHGGAGGRHELLLRRSRRCLARGMDERCSPGPSCAFLPAVAPLGAAHDRPPGHGHGLAYLSTRGSVAPGVHDRRLAPTSDPGAPVGSWPSLRFGYVNPASARRGPAEERPTPPARGRGVRVPTSGGHAPLGSSRRGRSPGSGAAPANAAGRRGDPDGWASVTCAGADDPKPQCRVGRLTGCPACVGWGDTSPTDDPIRKRHQDL
jgi:hypothetical protein